MRVVDSGGGGGGAFIAFYNPFSLDPGRREKINSSFHFHIYLWCLKNVL